MRGLLNAIIAFLVFIGIVLGFLFFLGRNNPPAEYTTSNSSAKTSVAENDATKSDGDTQLGVPESPDAELDGDVPSLDLTDDGVLDEGLAELPDETPFGVEDIVENAIDGTETEVTDIASAASSDAKASYGPISQTESSFVADIKVPSGLDTRAPAVAAAIMEASRAELADFQLTAADNSSSRPYELQTNWTVTGEAGDLVALQKDTMINAGGVHPNHFSSARTFLKSSGDVITVDRLFRGDSLSVGLFMNEVRNRITEQKSQRLSGAPYEMVRGEVADLIGENGSWIGEIAIVASDQPGKLGGLNFMFSPYEIGSYAEGSYDAVVPQSVFAHALKPEFASLFAGQPCWKDQSRGVVHPAPCPR